MIKFEGTKEAVNFFKNLYMSNDCRRIEDIDILLVSFGFSPNDKGNYVHYSYYAQNKNRTENISVYKNGGWNCFSGFKGYWKAKDKKVDLKAFRKFVYEESNWTFDNTGHIVGCENFSKETIENIGDRFFASNYELAEKKIKNFIELKYNKQYQNLVASRKIQAIDLLANTIRVCIVMIDEYNMTYDSISKVKRKIFHKEMMLKSEELGINIQKYEAFNRHFFEIIDIIYGRYPQGVNLSIIKLDELSTEFVVNLIYVFNNKGKTQSEITDCISVNINKIREILPKSLKIENCTSVFTQKMLCEFITYLSFIKIHCNIQKKQMKSSYNATIKTIVKFLSNIGSNRRLTTADCNVHLSDVKITDLLTHDYYLNSYDKKEKVA